MDQISIDDFKKVEIRVGEILSAEKVPDADKLLKLSVRFGPLPAMPLEGEVALEDDVTVLEKEPVHEIRQIISGIAAYFGDPQELVGVKCAFAYNLAPRTIRGHESNGMILAATGDNGVFSLLRADPDLPPGSAIR
jgi:methionyl-tRNA synthetase